MQKELRHFSQMTNVFQSLWLAIAGATQKELARQVKYLKVENEILRSKLPKRIVVTPKERQRLVRFARKLGKAIHHLTTIVSPKTLLGWIRAENLLRPRVRAGPRDTAATHRPSRRSPHPDDRRSRPSRGRQTAHKSHPPNRRDNCVVRARRRRTQSYVMSIQDTPQLPND